MPKLRNPYCVLVEDVTKLTSNATEKELEDAVELFRDQIQSSRVISYIEDFAGLITILEARCVLHSKNIGPLESIAKIINSKLALSLIKKYKENSSAQQVSVKLEVIAQQRIEDVVLEKVFSTVIKKLIPSDARNLARSLFPDLCEGEILTLTNQNPRDQAIFKILNQFRQNSSIDHIDTLRTALSLSLKRSDIVRDIDTIVNAP